MLNIICFHITVFKVSSANGTTVRQPDAIVYIFSITTSFGVVVEKMYARLLFTPLVSGRINAPPVDLFVLFPDRINESSWAAERQAAVQQTEPEQKSKRDETSL